MVKEYRILMIIIVAGCVLWMSGCASSGNQTANRKQRFVVPPGLDSTSAVQSARIADGNFVSSGREKEANKFEEIGESQLKKVDEFWAYLEGDVKDKRMNSSEKAQFDRALANGARALEQWKQITNDGQRNQMAQSARKACETARQHLEQAVKLNPFDKNARILLAMTYYNLQHIFGQTNNYSKAVEILERLVRIEKGEPDLYRTLAENYMAMREYKPALDHFKKAKDVLVKTSFDAPPDTSMLFYYEYMQGDMYARLYNAPVAIDHFTVAKFMARTDQEKADVENYIKWVNWDDGNIRGSEGWDMVVSLEQNKQYDKMEQLASDLIPRLTTKKAKLAVHHKLAVAEFEFLNKKPKAVERMRRVYESLTPQEIASPNEEAQAYLDAYGAMLFRFGVEAREHQEKKLALAYFNKATEFNWDQAAKAHFELVTLVWNTPQQAITHGKDALQMQNGLTEYEMCELMSLMTKAHKSAGLFDEARTYFNNWKSCQNQKGQVQNAE